MNIGRYSTRRLGPAMACISVLALVGVVAGCGASDDKTPDKTSGSENRASTGDASVNEFKAKAQAARVSTPADYSGPTDPVKVGPKIKIALISCAKALSGCQAPTDAAAEAASSLGWETRVYDGGGTGSGANAAMLSALSWGANAIGTFSIDGNLIQQGLGAAKKANVPVFSGDNGIASPNPVIETPAGKEGFIFDVSVDWPALGAAAADWIIGDSAGKANIVVFQDKEYPGSRAETKGLLDEFAKCGGCKVDVEDFTASELATTVPGNTVSYLRNHPDTEYLWSAFDPAAVVQVNAIKAAGLSERVKLISTIGAQQNLEFIRAGEVQVADAAYDNVYLGYAAIDQFLRYQAKQPLFEPQGENVPYVVLDKSNLTAPGQDWVAPFDYRAKFAALWQK